MIHLRDLVEVSNNSRITASVLKAIQENFSDIEMRDFKVWLRLVKENIDRKS